jgi:two-component system cell cycle sensor histidine kinase PleC
MHNSLFWKTPLEDFKMIKESEQKTENVMQYKQNKLFNILNTIEDGICVVNQQYDIEYVNDAIKKQFGSIEKHKCYQYLHNREEACLWCKFQEILEGKTIRWEWLSSKDQKIYDITDSPLENPDGSISKLQIFRDITEQKKAECVVQEAREYAESIVNTIRESLVVLDEGLRVISASPSFYKTFKVSPEETVGQLIYDLGNGQWNIPKLRELLEEIIPKHITFDDFEVEHDFEIIGRKTMLLNARLLNRDNGKSKMILLAVKDITEQKHLEELVKLRTDALNNQREQFISVLIHDLKGPLVPMLGFTKRLIDGKAKSQEDAITYLKVIHTSSQELLTTIENTSRDLREKSALKSFNPEKLNFKDILLSIVTKSLIEIENRGLEIFINGKNRSNWCELEGVIFKGDLSQLKTLIENLLGNAIKYAKSAIIIKFDKNDSDIHFVISDDGPGIHEEYQENIFEQYYQIPESKKGTGIGLFSVKKVVENHGGKIIIHSFINKGTSFEVTLPG